MAATETVAAAHLGRVARGGAVGLVGSATTAVAGFALVVVWTRAATPTEAGIFFAATSVFAVLVAVGMLGTDSGLARFLLRYEGRGRSDLVVVAIRAAALPVAACAVSLAALLLVLAAPVADLVGLDDRGAAALRWLALALPCAIAAEVGLAVTRAFGRMRTTVVIDKVLRALLQVVIVVLVLTWGGGVAAATAGWAAAYAVVSVLAVSSARRYVRERRRRGAVHAPPVVAADAAGEGGRSVVGDFWAFTWARGVARVAQIAIQKVDILIVAALLSPAHAAAYAAATRFVSLGQFATQAVQQVLQPRFTAILLEDDPDLLREVYRVATAWCLVLAWPLYVVVGAAPWVYLAIFGDRYLTTPAVVVVVTMALAMMAAVASGPVDTLLLMSGRSGASLINALIALAVVVTGCLVLVPPWGIAGAAVAWAAGVLTRCGLAFVQVRAALRVTPGGRPLLLAALLPVACFGAPVAAWALSGLPLTGYFLALLLGGACYLATLTRWRAPLRLDLLLAALRRHRR